MKKLLSFIISSIIIFLPVASGAYGLYPLVSNIAGGDNINAVTNTLSEGGSPQFSQALVLDGSYGINLGNVSPYFTVSADIKIDESVPTSTLFFKDMKTTSDDRWIGIVISEGVPKMWSYSELGKWKWQDSQGDNIHGKWVNIRYEESNGYGKLYLDDVLISQGVMPAGSGNLYLGATYWASDSLKGSVKNLSLKDDSFENYNFPSSVVIADIDLSPLGDEVVCVSDNESVISSSGKVTRGSEDCTVILTAQKGGMERSFEFTVLKAPSCTNDQIILSYDFTNKTNGIIFDQSGNNNHAVSFGGFTSSSFDGQDDCIRLPEDILTNAEEYSIIINFTPSSQKGKTLFSIGDSAQSISLVPRSAAYNSIDLIYKNGGDSKTISALPSLSSNEETNLIITYKNGDCAVFVNGVLLANGNIPAISCSKDNYIAHSSADNSFFSGDISSFSIIPFAPDSSYIHKQYYKQTPNETSYIKNIVFTDRLIVKTSRNCMVAAVFSDQSGKVTSSQTKKISDDFLQASFDAADGVNCTIYIYDPATGIIKETVNVQRECVYLVPQGDNFVIKNISSQAHKVVIIKSRFKNGSLDSVITMPLVLEANSSHIIPKDGCSISLFPVPVND